MKKSIYAFLLVVLGLQFPSVASAKTNLQNYWGNLASDQKTCGASDLSADVYIGQTGVTLCEYDGKGNNDETLLRACQTGDDKYRAVHSLQNPAYKDEYGILMLLATNVEKDSIGFCPVFAVGQNRNAQAAGIGNVWVSFAQAGTDCVQLYRTSPNGCVPRRIESGRWSGVKPVSVKNEHTIPIYEQKLKSCGHSPRDEHNAVMAITGWSPSGHGAYVQPVTIRSGFVREAGWYGGLASYVRAYTAGSRELLCAAGYRLNNDKTDCVEIDSAACMMAADNWCSGYSATNYNSETHTLVTDDTGCTRYVCSQVGYGFEGAGNQSSCVPCDVTNARGGISPDRGVCVVCEVGKYFNEKAKTTNYCSTAKPVSTLALLYGVNENSQIDLSEQCWTKTSASDYKNCVLGIATVLKKDLSSLKLFQPIQNSIKTQDLSKKIPTVPQTPVNINPFQKAPSDLTAAQQQTEQKQTQNNERKPDAERMRD